MKKFLFVLFTLLLLLTGCTPDNPEPGPEPTPPQPEDIGLTQKQFWEQYGTCEAFKGPEGYDIIFCCDDSITFFLENSGFAVSGQVKSFEYLKDRKYSVVITIPAFEGSEEMDPYDSYDMNFIFTIDKDNIFAMDVEGIQASGRYVAPESVIKGETFYLEWEDEYWCVGDRIFLTFYGMETKEVEGGGYYYTMVPSFDGKPFGTTLFDDNYNLVIYSANFAADFKAYRIDDYLILASSIAKMINGTYAEIIDIRTLQTVYTFEDVTFSLDPLAKSFTVSKPKDMMDDAKETKYTIENGTITVE